MSQKTAFNLTPMFDGFFNVSTANALSSTWFIGMSLTRFNWSLIAWNRQFPSPGMFTDRTCRPESVIFCKSISSWCNTYRMSSMETLKALAISTLRILASDLFESLLQKKRALASSCWTPKFKNKIHTFTICSAPRGGFRLFIGSYFTFLQQNLCLFLTYENQYHINKTRHYNTVFVRQNLK